jgi:hypothetical protein
MAWIFVNRLVRSFSVDVIIAALEQPPEDTGVTVATSSLPVCLKMLIAGVRFARSIH